MPSAGCVFRLLLLVFGLLISGSATPEETDSRGAIAMDRPSGARVALVVGNANYRNVPVLANPRNDATDIAAALRRLGFNVSVRYDLTYEQIRAALRDFGRAALGADTAVFYFAGHGIEVNNINHLIPVDAELESDLDVQYEAIPLEMVMAAVENSRGVRLVILDACRNNPFARKMIAASGGTRAIGRGFAAVEPSVGTLVGYAAKEGTTAQDGRGRNSPYTTGLLAHIEQPGLDIQFMFRRVRDDVLRLTDGAQEPFTYGSLPGEEIYMRLPEADSLATGADGLTDELKLWRLVRESNEADAIESYLERYPNGTFAALARARVDVLSRDGPIAAHDTGRQEPEVLVRELQRELSRVGCDPGNADGVWGKRTRTAYQAFSRAAGIQMASESPDEAMLEALRGFETRVCPLRCGPGQHVFDGKCVAAATAPLARSSGEPTAKSASCRVETRDECRQRARRAGVTRHSGFCQESRRRVICQ